MEDKQIWINAEDTKFLKLNKLAATVEKQQHCPYCHLTCKTWDSGYWDEATWQISRYRDDQ